jgi:hypothetical protein
MYLTLGGICNYVDLVPVAGVIAKICKILGKVYYLNIGPTTQNAICALLPITADPVYELEVVEQFDPTLFTPEHLLEQVSPPMGFGRALGPFNVELQSLSPVYWTSPMGNLLQNPSFDAYLCTVYSTYNPWSPSSIGIDTFVFPGNGV